MGLFDFFKKKEVLNIEEKETLDKGLEKTKEGTFSKLSRAVVSRKLMKKFWMNWKKFLLLLT
jgi:fused signal recognition particle receptor